MRKLLIAATLSLAVGCGAEPGLFRAEDPVTIESRGLDDALEEPIADAEPAQEARADEAAPADEAPLDAQATPEEAPVQDAPTDAVVEYRVAPADAFLPQEDVPCSIGASARIRYAISAIDMQLGTGSTAGAGFCEGTVHFVGVEGVWRQYTYNPGTELAFGPDTPYNGATWDVQCNAVHCGSVIYGDGSVEQTAGCTVIAFCDAETGLARAVGYTW
jgi:hypothetical protein